VELLTNTLLRTLLWSSFYNMVRDGLLKSVDYLRLVRNKIGVEQDPKLIGTILSRADIALSTFVPARLLQEEANGLFEVVHRKLTEATADDVCIVWASSCIDFAKSARSVQVLVEALGEGKKIGKFALDQSMRWRVVNRAMSWNVEGAAALLEAEQKRDGSDRGNRCTLTAKTSQWDAKVKEAAWQRYLDPESSKTLSHHQLSADMNGFRWPHQAEMLEKYTELFFTLIRKMFKERTKEFFLSWFHACFPFKPEEGDIVIRTRALLAECTKEEPVLHRTLQEKLDDLLRAQKCRALCLSD